MKRKLVLLLVLILATTSLAIPNTASAVPGFCETCGQGCWDEANTGEANILWWQCRDNGGSQPYCDNTVTIEYYNLCITVDCNMSGCNLPKKSPRQTTFGDVPWDY